jgi:hypothetical protein
LPSFATQSAQSGQRSNFRFEAISSRSERLVQSAAPLPKVANLSEDDHRLGLANFGHLGHLRTPLIRRGAGSIC